MFMKRHLRGAKRENVYWETVAGKMSDGKMSDGKISDGKLSTGKLYFVDFSIIRPRRERLGQKNDFF